MSDLEEAFLAQWALQREAYSGDDVRKLEGEARAEFIRWNVLALTDELHEALAEVGWKPWAKSRHLNREAYKGELVDAFHFFMNLCLAGDITAKELLDGYFEKRQRNIDRQQRGYSGLDKCPRCKRAYDDIDAKRTVTKGARFMWNGVTYCSQTCALDAA